MGLRNPWRWNFDALTGNLWLGDVGQLSFEEINVVQLGGNYGWRCLEGPDEFDMTGCPTGGLVDPILAYGRGTGNSITGGIVYRGQAIPSLHGRYVFGDYGTGWIGALRDDGSGNRSVQELIYGPDNVSAFAQDQSGEIFYADVNDGRIRRIVPLSGLPGAAVDTVPQDLALTGCVDPADPSQPAAGLIPYVINAPFWSDGAAKDRWLAVPNNRTIGVNAAGDWEFPPGSVLMKSFRLNDRLVETRLLMRHPDGIWAGYSYEWNESQTAATRVVGGKTRFVEGQSWSHPSEPQCRQCHVWNAGYTLGLENSQLNRNFTYAQTGRTANQLVTLASIGMLSVPLPPIGTIGRLADPRNSAEPVHARARAYLHTNCAQCHRLPSGQTPGTVDLRSGTALQNMGICNVTPTAGDLGIANARIVAPGEAARSLLAIRPGRRDAAGMPPVGSHLVDSEGVTLISTWINGLGSCIDTDNDQADDGRDNCINAPNVGQRDSDRDGYGNACDADLNNSGGIVNSTDLAIFRGAFGSTNEHADFNDDGIVSAADLAAFRMMFGRPPGPAATEAIR